MDTRKALYEDFEIGGEDSKTAAKVSALCLDANAIGDAGADVLSKFLRLDLLEEVSLQNVGITDHGFAMLVAAVVGCKKLRCIDLRNNAMLPADFDKELAVTGLRHFNKTCQVLF